MTFDELRALPAPLVRLASGELAHIVHWYPETKAIGVRTPNGRLHVLPVARLLAGDGCAVEPA
jgi:hypothetical protein